MNTDLPWSDLKKLLGKGRPVTKEDHGVRIRAFSEFPSHSINERHMPYRNIVVAIDLNDDCIQILRRARDLAITHGARIFPVHVIELTDMAFGSEAALDLPKFKLELLDQAQKYLGAFAAEYPGLVAASPRLVYGDPRSEIHLAALELAADLIMVGSHGRHGIALLFGSTANGMLHAAPCDVLAVRLSK